MVLSRIRPEYDNAKNMNTMNRLMLLSLHILCFFLVVGCKPAEQEMRVPDDVVTQNDALRNCLLRGGEGFDHLKEQDAIRQRYIDIADADVRKSSALSLGATLLSIGLKRLPYRQREGATRVYREYLYLAFDIMKKCGVESRVALDYYFNGLSKYRDSCLDISDKDILPGETFEGARWRRDCARKLKDDYRLALSIFERFWLPNLSRYLPPELHDEFRRRLKAFSTLPAQPEGRCDARNASSH